MKYTIFLLLFFLSCTFILSAPIKVAIIDPQYEGGIATRDQLNNDTYFDFDATIITVAQAESLATLSNYNAVIIGGSGSGAASGWTLNMANTLKTWVEGGGGLVATSWFDYELNHYATSIIQTMDSIVPCWQRGGTYQYVSGNASLTLINPTHPILSGITSVTFTANHTAMNSYGLDAGDVVLGDSGTNNHVLVANDSIGDGRSVYLGALYLGRDSYVTAGLRTGTSDRLLEQTVAWAAGTYNTVVPEANSAIILAVVAFIFSLRLYKKS